MITFVFPGQGSQKLNMLADFYHESVVIDTLDEASDILEYDLFELITEDETRLNQTQYTQPAILAVSIALYRLFLREHDIVPDCVAGHSLGEYTALVAAEVLYFKDALRLVAARGRLMQQAVPSGEGAMAAILGLNDSAVVEACQKAAAGEIVSAVNFNAPGQVVIAGQTQAVLRALQECKLMGAKRSLVLPVSVPSHCALMDKAAELLSHHFAEVVWHLPKVPLVHNVDGLVHETIDEIELALIAQLRSPVEWVKCIKKLAEMNTLKFIECGPGKVLTGLNKRIIPSIPCFNLEDRVGFDTCLASFRG